VRVDKYNDLKRKRDEHKKKKSEEIIEETKKREAKIATIKKEKQRSENNKKEGKTVLTKTVAETTRTEVLKPKHSLVYDVLSRWW